MTVRIFLKCKKIEIEKQLIIRNYNQCQKKQVTKGACFFYCNDGFYHSHVHKNKRVEYLFKKSTFRVHEKEILVAYSKK